MARLAAIGAVLRASVRLRRLRRTRAVLRGLMTAAVFGAVLAGGLPLGVLALLAFVLVDTTCAAVDGLLRPTPAELAALRERV